MNLAAENGVTAVNYAVKRDQIAVVNLLLLAGATLNKVRI